MLGLQPSSLLRRNAEPRLQAAASAGACQRPAAARRPARGRNTLQRCDALAVGIDLGTTSSALAVVGPDGQPHILQDAQGPAIVPSLVAFTRDGSVLVGEEAQQASMDGRVGPDGFFYSTKRLMGRRASEVQELASRLAYPVVAQPGPQPWAVLPHPYSGDAMLPQHAAACLLRHLLDRAEAHLGRAPLQSGPLRWRQQASFPALQTITEAVITVPAHFSPAARAATIEAGRLAGLTRVQLLQEPVAAALAYGYGVSGPASTSYDTLLVFDLGGGTLDVSLLEGWDGILEVLATEGDDQLGGDDLTRCLGDLLLSKAGRNGHNGRGLASLDPATRLEITRAAEGVKRAASEVREGEAQHVALPGGAVVTVTQNEVAAAWTPLLTRMWPPLRRLAVGSRLQFDGKLLEAAGGIDTSTDLSATHRGPAHQLFKSPPGAEAAAGPAAKYTAAPRRLTGLVLAGAATRTPAVHSFVTQLCGMQPAAGVDPEHVVALGAALQAGVLSGQVGRGAELADGGYLASEHGRSSGWSSDVSVEWVP